MTAAASTPEEPPPVVEGPPPDANTPDEASQRALQLRIRQQEILAELGVVALRGVPLQDLLDEAVRLAAEGLEAEFCKILERIPGEDRLLLRAGVGWDPGLVGVATIGADMASPSGFALRTGKPVISNHLENEKRFRTPELLAAHGVRRAINVILQGDGTPYGVLEVDSRSEGEFAENDLAFLQGAANIIGMAIERQRHERALKAALEHHRVLVKEINHRVKNSLQLVASILSLRANAQEDPALTQLLAETSSRINAIARAHERLYRSPDVATIELSAYLRDVCSDLDEMTPNCEVVLEPSDSLKFATDQAIRLALLVTELVTNSVKHGFPNGTRGRVAVRLTRKEGSTATVSVRDDGKGVPRGFDILRSRGMGMRLVRALADQLDAVLVVEPGERGVGFALHIPVEPNGGEEH